jgi:hypothetical protein
MAETKILVSAIVIFTRSHKDNPTSNIRMKRRNQLLTIGLLSLLWLGLILMNYRRSTSFLGQNQELQKAQGSNTNKLAKSQTDRLPQSRPQKLHDPYIQTVGIDKYPRSYKLQTKVKYRDILKNLGAALKRGEKITSFDYIGPDGQPTKVSIDSHTFFDDDPEGIQIQGSLDSFPGGKITATFTAGYECASGNLDSEKYFAYEPQQDDDHLYLFTYDVNEMLRDHFDSQELDRQRAAKDQQSSAPSTEH